MTAGRRTLDVVPLPYRLLIAAVGVGLVAFYAYRSGVTAADERHRVEQLEQALAYAAAYQQEVERGNEIAKQHEEAQRKARTHTARLATATAGLRDCGSAPGGLVRLHDAAAAQTGLPSATGEPACAPSAVTNTELARVIVENYGACNGYIDQLNALITFLEGRT
jgi:hypothetical protein